MKTRIGLSLLGLAALNACTIGPVYHQPDMPLPAHYREDPAWVKAQPKDDAPKGDWWTAFGDDTLNKLVAQVNISNQNLLAAQAQYRQAVALAKQADAAYFPTVTGGVAETRSFTGGGAGTGNFKNGTINNNYRLNFNASWEPDLWGSIAQSADAAKASQQASLGDLQAARLSTQTQLVKNYFALRIADTQSLLLGQTVDAYQKALEVSTNQYEAGIVTKADVASATAQLKAAQAQVAANQLQRVQLEHAIAVLLGKAPSEFSIAPLNQPYTLLPPAIAPELPATLLERRPDIAAAERRVAAANAKVGVTEAAFFPNLTLSAAAGFQNSAYSNWLTYPARFWSVGPALAQTLFDGGLRTAQKEQAIAVYDQTVAQYRQTVLGALQEVEDNLAGLNLLAQQAQLQNEAVKAAQESLELNTNQYKAGTVSYLNVLTAQTTLLNNQRTALTVQGDRLTAAAALIAALGGGY